MSDSDDPTTNDLDGKPIDRFKDSCSYSIEVAKQFLTYAASGIAFALALNYTASSPALKIIILGLFVFSLIFGLLYIMSLVAHINQSKNYDVYTGQLRFFSIAQILFIFAGIILLGGSLIKNKQLTTSPIESGLLLKCQDIELHIDKPELYSFNISKSGDKPMEIHVSQKSVPGQP